MAAAASKHGVDFRYGTDGHTRSSAAAAGRVAVHTADGERIPADVGRAQPRPAGGATASCSGARPRPVRRLRYSPSCFLLLGRVDAPVPQVAHHNIHFGRRGAGVFDEIIDGPADERPVASWSPTPRTPTRRWRPAGAADLLRVVPDPEPRARRSTGPDARPAYREHVLAHPGGARLHRVRRRDRGRGTSSPRPTGRDQGMAAGAPFAAAHTFGQTGPFRPATTCGARTSSSPGRARSPGVGVPMVLISGRLAAERITGPDPTLPLPRLAMTNRSAVPPPGSGQDDR